MSYHEKPALSLYRNIGKQGIFTETFLKPLKRRKPNPVEAIGNEEITLTKMLEEAYVPPPPPTRELDVQAMFDRHRVEVREEKTNSYKKAGVMNFVIGTTTVLSFITTGFSTIITAILFLVWLVLLLLVYLT